MDDDGWETAGSPKGKKKNKSKPTHEPAVEAPAPAPAAKEETVQESAPESAPDSPTTTAKKSKSNKMPAAESPVEKDAAVKKDAGEEQSKIRKELDQKHKGFADKFHKIFDDIPDLHQGKGGVRQVSDQQRILNGLIREIDATLQDVRVTKPKNGNIEQITQQVNELKEMKGSIPDDQLNEMKAEAEATLAQALAFESFRSFQAEMTSLKERCQARMGSNDVASKSMKSMSLLGRVAGAKGVKADTLQESSIVTVFVPLPEQLMSIAAAFVPRFSQRFGVVLDPLLDAKGKGEKGAGKGDKGASFMEWCRQGGVAKGLIVHGIGADTHTAVSALKALDLSESKVVTNVSPEQIDAIILDQPKYLNKFAGVYMLKARGMLSVYGPKAQLAACCKFIEENKPDASKCQSPPRSPTHPRSGLPSGDVMTFPIERDFEKCVIGAEGCVVRKIQQETNTTIRIGDKDWDSPDSHKITVTVMGHSRQAQQKAKDQIISLLKTMECCLVECDTETIDRLFAQKLKGQDAEKSRFSLVWNSGTTVLKKSNGMMLVGTHAQISKWRPLLQEAIKELSGTPIQIPVTFEQSKLWTQKQLDQVKASTRVDSIHKDYMHKTLNGPKDKCIAIYGDDDSKAKAKAMIEDYHSKLQTTVIRDISNESKLIIIGKQFARVHEIEKKHNVCLIVGGEGDMKVTITGLPADLPEARQMTEDILAGKFLVTRELEIGAYEAYIIIGKGGETISWIKAETGLDSLIINAGDDDSDAKRVVFKGSEQACEAAEKLIKEELEKARAQKAAQNNKSWYEETEDWNGWEDRYEEDHTTSKFKEDPDQPKSNWAKKTAPTGTLEFSIPEEFAVAVIGKGGAVSLQIKKDSGVHRLRLADSEDGKTKTVMLGGTEKQCNDAKRMIQEVIQHRQTNANRGRDTYFVRNSNAATREVPILWGQGRAIIGKGGSTIGWLKQESGIDQIMVEDGDGNESKKVVFTGSAKACDRCEKLIKEVLEKGRSGGDPVIREKTIQADICHLVIGKGGATVNEIRTDSGLEVLKMINGDSEAVKKLILRGTPEACDKAEKKIDEIISSKAEKKIDKAENHGNAQTSRGQFTRYIEIQAVQARTIIGKGGQKANELRTQSGVDYLKVADHESDEGKKHVVIRGARAACEEAERLIKDLLANTSKFEVDGVSFEVPISWADASIIIGARGCNATYIKAKSGVEVFKVNTVVENESKVVVLRGSEEACAEAERLIYELLAAPNLRPDLREMAAPSGNREFDIEWSSSAVVIGKGGETINSIKDQTGCDIKIVNLVKFRSKKVVLRGSPEVCEAAEKLIRQELAKVSDVVTRQIEITYDEGSKVIGKGGETIKAIKEECGLDVLKVVNDETCLLVLRGTNEACDIAEAKVAELLAAQKSYPPRKNSGGGYERRQSGDSGAPKPARAAPAAAPPAEDNDAEEEEVEEDYDYDFDEEGNVVDVTELRRGSK